MSQVKNIRVKKEKKQSMILLRAKLEKYMANERVDKMKKKRVTRSTDLRLK